MHSSGRLGSPLVQGKTRGTGGSIAIRSSSHDCAHTAHLYREPNQRYLVTGTQAGSDHPAVDVRTWRDESNVSLAQESSQADADEHRGWQSGPRTSGAAIARQVEEPEPDAARDRRCNGDAM